MKDFANENLHGTDWLIIDDQLGVIKERGNLILSKKYMVDSLLPDEDERIRQAFFYQGLIEFKNNEEQQKMCLSQDITRSHIVKTLLINFELGS